MGQAFEMTERHMAAFERQQRQRFEDEMFEHLRSAFPADFARVGETEVRSMIRDGIDRARSYDIVMECDVARYVELMLTMGPDFDRSTVTSWAGEILAGTDTGAEKLDQIYEHLMFGAADGGN